MPQYLTHEDGKLQISETADGSLEISAEPADPSIFISRRTIKTSYPPELISLIFNTKGIGWVCDEIARDEDPNYVSKYLLNDLLAYFEPSKLNGSRILDFGCGSGASTAILARRFPDSTIVGVELNPELLAVARARSEFYGFRNVDFHLSPSGLDLPSDIGSFDYVVMSAVYEHLLPNERKVILNKVWNCVRADGALFIDQTPNQLFPVELHTTYLPLINYFPDGLALWYARRFSKQINPTESWESLLRQGIRGATVREITRNIESRKSRPLILKPNREGIRDRIDLWFASTDPENLRAIKSAAKYGLKAINSLTGFCIVPDLAVAIRKV